MHSAAVAGDAEIPMILPVPPGIVRPLWSVMIPTFNCARFLRRTLVSVLEQDLGPEQMQIEVVDDHSSADDPQAVVEQIGHGRVQFYRKPKNEGPVRNFNTCVERSRGHLIHILHGDDYVARDFYSEFGAAFEASRPCAGIFSRAFFVDEQELVIGLSDFVTSLRDISTDPSDLTAANPIRTPAAVVRRSFYEQYGGFNPSLIHVADWDVWVRVVLRGGARMLDKPLAFYRLSTQMHTNQMHRRADHHRDQFRLAEVWQNHALPGFDQSAFQRLVLRQAFADWRNYRAARDDEAALANYEFWRSHCSWRRRAYTVLADWLRQRIII